MGEDPHPAIRGARDDAGAADRDAQDLASDRGSGEDRRPVAGGDRAHVRSARPHRAGAQASRGCARGHLHAAGPRQPLPGARRRAARSDQAGDGPVRGGDAHARPGAALGRPECRRRSPAAAVDRKRRGQQPGLVPHRRDRIFARLPGTARAAAGHHAGLSRRALDRAPATAAAHRGRARPEGGDLAVRAPAGRNAARHRALQPLGAGVRAARDQPAAARRRPAPHDSDRAPGGRPAPGAVPLRAGRGVRRQPPARIARQGAGAGTGAVPVADARHREPARLAAAQAHADASRIRREAEPQRQLDHSRHPRGGAAVRRCPGSRFVRLHPARPLRGGCGPRLHLHGGHPLRGGAGRSTG